MDFLHSHTRKGRSRFSKALPIPPQSPALPPPLPPPPPPERDPSPRSRQLPWISSVPPPPPPHVPSKKTFTMSDKPLPPPQTNHPLPVLPPLQTKALPPVHIQRRPVGKQATSSQPHPPHPTSAKDDRNSIGSLLSAYSKSSGESLMSPDGSASQRASTPPDASDHLYGTEEAKMLTAKSLSSADHEHHHRAQEFAFNKGLPPKPSDDDKQGPPPRPVKPEAPPPINSPASGVSSPVAHRPLWRRRSIKSDRAIEVPQLQLTVSHGSTAASQPNSAHTLSPSASLPTNTLQQQRQRSPPCSGISSTSNLHRNHVRPVLSPDQASSGAGNPGQEASRSKGKVSHPRDGQRALSHGDKALSPTQRLPTPDYEQEDVRTHVVDRVVSPVSPASSPEPARDEASDEVKHPIPRKAVAARGLDAAHGLPKMRADGSQVNKDGPRTEARAWPVSPLTPSAQPQAREQQKSERPQYLTPRAQPAVAVAAAEGAEGDVRPTTRDQRAHQQAIEEQDELNKPSHHEEEDDDNHERQLPVADPRASFLALYGCEPLSAGVIYKALPLKESMFDCYVRHRVMDRTRNRNYALSCQTCGKADTEDRYKCQFCYVRMCGACLHVFNGQRRDLKKLVAYLQDEPHSGDSHDCPASMEGIEPKEDTEEAPLLLVHTQAPEKSMVEHHHMQPHHQIMA